MPVKLTHLHLQSSLGRDGEIFATATAGDGVHKPGHEEARPDKENFGDAQSDTQPKEQVGFSRQC